MKRLLVLFLSGLLVACGGDTNPQNAATGASAQVFNWKMVTTWPANFPVFQEGVERFASDVKQMSGGRLNIQVYAGGQLVPPLQVFDAVSQGSVEMGHGSAYYWAGTIPAAQFLSSVPFGMTASGMNSWLYSGDGLSIWRELYKPYGLVPFPMGNSGVQMGGWFNKRINSLDDIKGLKMRIPGLGGKVFARAGGNPVLMAGSELYTALERGTLDATEWVGPFHDQRLGLHRAARYYYYPGWHEPGTVLELIVGAGAWAQLPDDLKKIIGVAAAATDIWVYSQFEKLNAEALRTLKDDPNVEILPFPDDVIAELHSLTRQTLDEEAAKDELFAKVYAAYQSFRVGNQRWNRISSDAYHRSLNQQESK